MFDKAYLYNIESNYCINVLQLKSAWAGYHDYNNTIANSVYLDQTAA